MITFDNFTTTNRSTYISKHQNQMITSNRSIDKA